MSDENKIIDIYKDIYEDNNKLSDKIKEDLLKNNVSLFNLLGTPGCGKTTFLTTLIKNIQNIKTLVIEGDVESDIDTIKLRELGIDAYQINTHGGCHLDAIMLDKALKNIDIKNLDIIFIENVGNLICPAEFYLGEKKRILLTSITEGSDKPYKYPLAFETSDVIVINKFDLLPHLDFNEDYFTKGVRLLNKQAPIFKISSLKNEGFSDFIEWLINSCNEK